MPSSNAKPNPNSHSSENNYDTFSRLRVPHDYQQSALMQRKSRTNDISYPSKKSPDPNVTAETTETSSSSSCSAVSDSLATNATETSCSSSHSSLNCGSSCSRSIVIHVDFKTELKIDMNFECTVNNQTICKDVIYRMLRRINSFISVCNEMNACEHQTKYDSTDASKTSRILEAHDYDESVKMLALNFEPASQTKTFKLVEENVSLYYLVVVFDAKETFLLNNYSLSSIKETWTKGTFYLRKKIT